MSIVQSITGSKRYVLQQFIPNDVLLNPAWGQVEPYSKDRHAADGGASKECKSTQWYLLNRPPCRC